MLYCCPVYIFKKFTASWYMLLLHVTIPCWLFILGTIHMYNVHYFIALYLIILNYSIQLFSQKKMSTTISKSFLIMVTFTPLCQPWQSNTNHTFPCYSRQKYRHMQFDVVSKICTWTWVTFSMWSKHWVKSCEKNSKVILLSDKCDGITTATQNPKVLSIQKITNSNMREKEERIGLVVQCLHNDTRKGEVH